MYKESDYDYLQYVRTIPLFLGTPTREGVCLTFRPDFWFYSEMTNKNSVVKNNWSRVYYYRSVEWSY